MIDWVLLLPLGSSLGYAVAALFIKRAVDAGMGPWRMCFWSNFALWLVFLPTLHWWEPGWRLDPWWPPFLAGCLFFCGQMLTMLSLTRGDVSIATPVLGTKVILVAVCLVVFAGEALGWRIWTAAGLSLAGIWLLQGGGAHADRARTLRTVLLAASSALAFSIADVLVQMWTRPIGFGLFVLVSSSVNLALSFALWPLFSAAPWSFPPRAARFVFAGSGLIALQAFALFVAIGMHGRAAEANILYSARGMWSVALVWAVGHWFGNTERADAGAGRMGRRLAGAALIFSGIVLTLVG